jgi:DNA recombination protein RmuC
MDSTLLLLAGLALGASVTTVVWLVGRQQLVADRARLQAELDATQRAADEQKAALAQAQAQLRDTFAALSKDALKENRQDFLVNAGAMLQPVRETLDKVRTQLAEVDKAREGSFQAVTTQLGSLLQAQEQLRQTTEGLSRSLRSPNVRGKWGEIQLKRIVELAGMLEQCDFVEKESATTEDGARQTPDLVVRLPGDASIVIDSKVPIEAYLEAVNAKDDAVRQAGLAAHARQVREHIRSLGSKEYWKQFPTSPEFVVMFLPLEPLLAAAFEHDGTLLEQAASLRVIPATPMTLLALLKAVAHGWKQQQLARNAEEIQLIGRELYDRLATMVTHLESIGSSIKQAADSYDRFVGSLEQKVLPAARRFKELGVSSTKDLEIPEPLTLSMRRVKKDELMGQPPDDPIEATPLRPLLEGEGTARR